MIIFSPHLHIFILFHNIIASDIFLCAEASILLNVGADIHIFSAQLIMLSHSKSASLIASYSSIRSWISSISLFAIPAGLK